VLREPEQHFRGCSDIVEKACCVQTVKGIADHAIYGRIAAGRRRVAEKLGCSLTEVDCL